MTHEYIRTLKKTLYILDTLLSLTVNLYLVIAVSSNFHSFLCLDLEHLMRNK